MAQAEKLDLGEEKTKSSPMKLILIIAASVLVTLLLVFGTLYVMGVFSPKAQPAIEGNGQEAATDAASREEAKPVIYETLAPAFVVNFKNNPEIRTVQIEVTLASTDKDILDAVKKHLPMVRNNLLMLLAGQDPSSFKAAEGKEALREKIKAEINEIVVAQTGRKTGVDDVFFTGFVMQ